ncbi:unnamed protein product [Tilletia controversa]|uniref:Uncharacterized protein n=2 Tax=Tilletia TaxID=13289 RepID=A0A8X7SVZ8_9BASI|nr:hypothetical protein CF336_g4804 [Tilletia laevis]KAE8197622.1 hypothetical protein CF328_g3797 [Tilletia controversa]KAE8261282.1 hypothetical protein A4X03_0g3391 [Tilletia caries]KAE8202765.1 hypothetical protein CF335_g3291 [Tilletia laevis]KAE8245531.1 hypothetical protein A4X06_0g5626 [Tilletia controversa]
MFPRLTPLVSFHAQPHEPTVAVVRQWEKELATKSTKVPALSLREPKVVPQDDGVIDLNDDDEVRGVGGVSSATQAHSTERRAREGGEGRSPQQALLPFSRPPPRCQQAARQLREYDIVSTSTYAKNEYKSAKGKAASSDDDKGDVFPVSSDDDRQRRQRFRRVLQIQVTRRRVTSALPPGIGAEVVGLR